jgi:hypothetical protein
MLFFKFSFIFKLKFLMLPWKQTFCKLFLIFVYKIKIITMRIFNCEICSYKPIIFGDLVAKQFVLFEHKLLFGIIFFYFKGGEQDRFHTWGTVYTKLLQKKYHSYLGGIFNLLY